MAKSNKGNKKVAQAVVVASSNGATRGKWHGLTVCSLLRNMGYSGYTCKQAAQLLAAVGLNGTSSSTVSCQVGAGRQYAAGVAKPHHTGGAAALTGDVLAAVKAVCGAPANPVQPPAKPAKASKGKPAGAK